MIHKVYWGNIGIMENQMETTIVSWGVYRDNGKENGSYHSIIGAYIQSPAPP